jgi:hypothetical protein
MAERQDYKLTPEQFERGLTHDDAEIRFAFAHRKEFSPNRKQLERGMLDEDEDVRAIFSRIQSNHLREQFQSSNSQTNRKAL